MRVSLADPLRATELLSSTVASPAAGVDAEHKADSGFGQVFQGIGRELERGEATTRSAIASITSGAQVDPGQLIALQTGVYRYSEAIDLASRLVDHVTGGVKTVLQGTGQ
jgi:hypothetical protein